MISSFNAPISILSCFSLTYFSEWVASCIDLLSVYIYQSEFRNYLIQDIIHLIKLKYKQQNQHHLTQQGFQ